MTFRDPQQIAGPYSMAPLLLMQATHAFLETRGGDPRAAALLASLEQYLGTPAPLLAYTKLTGKAWEQTLPPHERNEAQQLLSEFRAFLRDGGWLDAARPVNLLD